MKIIHNEFRMISMKRTGHHSIQNWIFSGFKDPKLKIEHMDFTTGGKVTAKNKGRSRESINKVLHGLSSLNLLTYDFQQVDLNELHQRKIKDPNAIHMWPATKEFTVERSLIIIVLRDPYNWAASTIKCFKKVIPAAVARYKQHLKQALGIQDYLGGYPFVVIDYNRWFTSEDYRAEIISKLGMNIEATQYQEVAVNGAGSSFDKVKFRKQAGKMKVLNRWEHYKKHKVFMNIFKDKELVELSVQFGYHKPEGLIIV